MNVFHCVCVCARSSIFVYNENVILSFAPTHILSLSFFPFSVLCCEFAGTRFIFRLLEYIARVLHSFYLFQFRARDYAKMFSAYAVHILMCLMCVCVLVDYLKCSILLLCLPCRIHFYFVHSSLPDTNDRLTMATAVTGITPHVTF